MAVTLQRADAIILPLCIQAASYSIALKPVVFPRPIPLWITANGIYVESVTLHDIRSNFLHLIRRKVLIDKSVFITAWMH